MVNAAGETRNRTSATINTTWMTNDATNERDGVRLRGGGCRDGSRDPRSVFITGADKCFSGPDAQLRQHTPGASGSFTYPLGRRDE